MEDQKEGKRKNKFHRIKASHQITHISEILLKKDRGKKKKGKPKRNLRGLRKGRLSLRNSEVMSVGHGHKQFVIVERRRDKRQKGQK